MIERECDGRLALFETLHVHFQACRQDSSRQEITCVTEGKSDDGVTRGRAKHCVAQRVLCTHRAGWRLCTGRQEVQVERALGWNVAES